MDVKLALTGFGNVGQGIATLLQEHGQDYRRRYGVGLVLTGVADRGGAVTDRTGLDLGLLLTAKQTRGTVARAPGGETGVAGEEFLDRAGAQVLLEAASTNFTDAEPGYGYVLAAFARSMDVVLASKGALVLHFDELMNTARQEGHMVRYAGTVGAPLPVLELAERTLVGDRINGFEGILNATTNQILTAMENGATYDDGVRRAQDLGIAETDPTLDVDGWDAAAKVVIVANSVLDGHLTLDDVERQGIRTISPEELDAASAAGQTIKLIGRARRGATGITAEVKPERRDADDVLGRLRNDEMGIIFETDVLGRLTSTVQQTGGVPTALTVLRDVINLARDRGWCDLP